MPRLFQVGRSRSRPTRCSVGAALVAACALVLGGCGGNRPEQTVRASSAQVPSEPRLPDGPPVSLPQPLPQRAVTEITHPKGGVRMSAPPVDVLPAVSAEAAYQTFIRDGLRPLGAAEARQELLLTMYSDDNYRDIDPSSGKTTPRFQNVLSWAVVFHGVKPTVRGGATRSGERPTLDPSLRCDFVYLVDATTGQYMTAFQDCPGKG
jgi:hypothetical protein